MAKTYKFKNFKQLHNYMETKTKKVLDELAKDVMEELKQMVDENMYSWTPKKYKRTKMFIKSISKTKVEKVGNLYRVKIFFDHEKIEAIIRMPNEWNAHANFSGEEVAKGIIYWMEYGNDKADGTPNKYYQHEGYGFIQDTYEWLHYEYNKLFRDKVRKLGIPTQ